MECKLAKDVDCSKTENRQLTEENKSEKNKLPIIGTIGKFIGL